MAHLTKFSSSSPSDSSKGIGKDTVSTEAGFIGYGSRRAHVIWILGALF